jgi:hypothetical protein
MNHVTPTPEAFSPWRSREANGNPSARKALLALQEMQAGQSPDQVPLIGNFRSDMTPAQLRREHALEDARRAYFAGKSRLLAEFQAAKDEIDRRYLNGELDRP